MKNAILALSMLAASYVSAQSVKIDFTKALVALDGKTITLNPTTNTPMTLGDAAVQALETQLPADTGKDGLYKFKLDQLARKIYQNKKAELTPEEIQTIKDRIGVAYSPGIVGATYTLLQ